MYGFPPILILVLQLVLTHRLQHGCRHRCNRVGTFNSCLRTGCNLVGNYNGNKDRAFNSCLRTGCNGSGRRWNRTVVTLQLVLTHRLQPVQQHRDGNRAAFNSCLRTGCNFCMLYLEKCGLLPSTRAYAQVATFPTMTGRYRFEPFNSCLRTGCNRNREHVSICSAPFNSCLRTGCN